MTLQNIAYGTQLLGLADISKPWVENTGFDAPGWVVNKEEVMAHMCGLGVELAVKEQDAEANRNSYSPR